MTRLGDDAQAQAGRHCLSVGVPPGLGQVASLSGRLGRSVKFWKRGTVTVQVTVSPGPDLGQLELRRRAHCGRRPAAIPGSGSG